MQGGCGPSVDQKLSRSASNAPPIVWQPRLLDRSPSELSTISPSASPQKFEGLVGHRPEGAERENLIIQLRLESKLTATDMLGESATFLPFERKEKQAASKDKPQRLNTNDDQTNLHSTNLSTNDGQPFKKIDLDLDSGLIRCSIFYVRYSLQPYSHVLDFEENSAALGVKAQHNGFVWRVPLFEQDSGRIELSQFRRRVRLMATTWAPVARHHPELRGLVGRRRPALQFRDERTTH